MKNFYYILFVILLSIIPELPLQAQPPAAEPPDAAVMVISGGGARGAWGAGLAKALDEQLNFDYKYIVGTSTGALMAPLVAIEDFETLEKVYTQSTNKSILNKKIFNKKGKFKLRSYFAAVFNDKSISSSKPLRKLMDRVVTVEKWNALQNSGTEIEVSTIGLELGTLRYRSSNEYDRNEMLDWIWASANQPAFMTPLLQADTFLLYSHKDKIEISSKLLKKYGTNTLESKSIGNGVYEHTIESQLNWVDGGAMENIPIMRALEIADSMQINDVVIIVNNKAPHQIYQTKDIGTEPWVPYDADNKDFLYDSVATTVIEQYETHRGLMVQQQSPPIYSALEVKDLGEPEELELDVRISSKVELDMRDIALLLNTPERSGSFETDVFNNSKNFKTKGVINKLLATIDAFSKETFMNDIATAIQSEKANGMTFHIFFMPLEMYALNPLSLAFNKKKMKVLFENGSEFVMDAPDSKLHAEYFRSTIGQEELRDLREVFVELESACVNSQKDQIIQALVRYDNILKEKS